MLPFSARFFFENHLDRTFLSHVHRTKMIFSYATQCKLHKERNNLCLKSTKKINSKTWLIISFRKQYIWCKVFCNVKIVINSTIAGLFTYNFINLEYKVILQQINYSFQLLGWMICFSQNILKFPKTFLCCRNVYKANLFFITSPSFGQVSSNIISIILIY